MDTIRNTNIFGIFILIMMLLGGCTINVGSLDDIDDFPPPSNPAPSVRIILNYNPTYDDKRYALSPAWVFEGEFMALALYGAQSDYGPYRPATHEKIFAINKKLTDLAIEVFEDSGLFSKVQAPHPDLVVRLTITDDLDSLKNSSYYLRKTFSYIVYGLMPYSYDVTYTMVADVNGSSFTTEQKTTYYSNILLVLFAPFFDDPREEMLETLLSEMALKGALQPGQVGGIN
jgi:hypothetical protein